MRKPLIHITLAALVVTTVVAVSASPALASPSGIGWSGSWEYTSTTSVSVAEAVPGASLSATGTDTDGSSRSFSVSLTDTNSGDGQCAYVSWSDGSLNTVNSTCNGTISFTPVGEDGDVDAQLCLRNASTNALTHCNYVAVPTTFGSNAFIRNAGYGFEYAYHTPNDYAPENWDATIMLGQVWYDVFGFDNWGSTYGRMLENSLFTFSAPTFSCASGQLLSSSPASSIQLCGPNQSGNGPTGVTTTQYGSGAMACQWPTIVRRGGTIVKNCIAVSIPMPN
jgi:hypothetical protein